MPKKKKSVAELMRAWRTAAGLSTTEAGERLNLSPRTVENIEQGLRRVDDEVLRIALLSLIEST